MLENWLFYHSIGQSSHKHFAMQMRMAHILDDPHEMTMLYKELQVLEW